MLRTATRPEKGGRGKAVRKGRVGFRENIWKGVTERGDKLREYMGKVGRGKGETKGKVEGK